MTDSVFTALSDGHRREMLARLVRSGPLTTQKTTEGLGLTRQGATRHLEVLISCGLITSQKSGRTIYREANLAPLRGTQEWMDQLAREWDARLNRLKSSYGSPTDRPPDSTE